MEQKTTPNTPPNPVIRAVDQPREQGSLNIDDFVRIYDPNSQKVLVEKRS